MTPGYHEIASGQETLRIAVLFRESGEDLVFFIHGLGCSMESFTGAWEAEPMLPFSLLAIDLPGFGRSSKPANYSYTMNDHADICLAVLAKFSHPRVHVVAHSMGGAVGLLLAERLGDRLVSFVNVEGNLVTEDCSVSRKAASAQLGHYRRQLLGHLRIITAHSPERGLHHWYAGVKMSGNEGLNRSALSLVEHSCSGRLLELFRTLPCRSAYVHGDKNAALPVLEKLEGIPIISIENSGHFPMVDNPETFFSRIAAFMLLP